jgi:hypothetical protein
MLRLLCAGYEHRTRGLTEVLSAEGGVVEYCASVSTYCFHRGTFQYWACGLGVSVVHYYAEIREELGRMRMVGRYRPVSSILYLIARWYSRRRGDLFA